MGVCCRSLERALRARVGSSRGKAQLPKLGSRLFQFGAPLKKTQVQSAAQQRNHVDRVGTELKMVFRLKI